MSFAKQYPQEYRRNPPCSRSSELLCSEIEKKTAAVEERPSTEGDTTKIVLKAGSKSV